MSIVILSKILLIIVSILVLSGDNAVVIALATRKLPASSQNKAIVIGAAGAVPFLSHHEGGTERRRAFHAQPGTDGPGTAAHPSGGLLRICIGAHAATLPAACRPAFRIRGGPGSGSPGEAGPLS